MNRTVAELQDALDVQRAQHELGERKSQQSKDRFHTIVNNIIRHRQQNRDFGVKHMCFNVWRESSKSVKEALEVVFRIGLKVL